MAKASSHKDSEFFSPHTINNIHCYFDGELQDLVFFADEELGVVHRMCKDHNGHIFNSRRYGEHGKIATEIKHGVVKLVPLTDDARLWLLNSR